MTDPQDVPHAHTPDDDAISLYAIFRVLLQYRYPAVVAALLVGLSAAGWGLTIGRSYTAQAMFMPQGGSATTGLAALAGQFGIGINIPQGELTQSPLFYEELLGSRELLGRLLVDTFSVAFDPVTGAKARRGTLTDLFEIEEDTEPLTREKTLRTISDAIVASTEREIGVVRFEVTTPWADLSQAVAWRLIELVNRFNLETRQTTAAAESRFVEERLEEKGDSLRVAEEKLRTFLEANRQFENSPQLRFEHDRLQRQVLHQQQLYTSLQQSLEGARIAQVHNTPLITVVEPPERPVYQNPRGVRLRGLLGLLMGGMAVIIFGFVRELLTSTPPHEDPEYQKFRKVWSETLADLRLKRRRSTSDPGSSAGT